MAWKIDLSSNALRQLRKLDKPIATRILKLLRDRIEKLDDPRKIGERLQGPLGDFWKYRVGDYRVICSLQDDKLLVWVVRIGHRREVYSG
ncbi:MAG: type II toxin-antitoxin system RelE/ParE family toxin [Candidatus Sulfotelmatobacter sp.]